MLFLLMTLERGAESKCKVGRICCWQKEKEVGLSLPEGHRSQDGTEKMVKSSGGKLSVLRTWKIFRMLTVLLVCSMSS